jgi:asparagine synthase (glutamine-hydrolysing)
MADSIVHRGPDDEGLYAAGQVGLAFRRLSIIDLATGHQPLCNEDRTIWIVFNGEIYNYQGLRKDLVQRGHQFTTTTDTEVIVHLYEEYGIDGLEELRGMFAFALWDSRQGALLLARDRLGIKPLYYAVTASGLVFGSEVKAILAEGSIEPKRQRVSVEEYLLLGYTPGEETAFDGIKRVAPGSYVQVIGDKVTTQKYWDLKFSVAPISLKEASVQLDELMRECVRQHLISDVPVGVLLSGGVDSGAVLSYATEAAGHPLATFTLGFEDGLGIADERRFARLSAKAYGSDHYEMTMSAQQFADAIPLFVRHVEEPVCEPPGIALYYVTKMASAHVKVLLAGEGGDEAFGGYQTYRNVVAVEAIKRILGPARLGVASMMSWLGTAMSSPRTRSYAAALAKPFAEYYFGRTAGPSGSGRAVSSGNALADGAKALSEVFRPLFAASTDYDLVNRMLYVDSRTWLPDDLLVKADKVSMANSIELRVPFLDHKLMEFAATLPGRFKVRRGTTKYIAKRVLGRRVPSEIIRRPKTGFTVPYVEWLRGELQEWCAAVLLDPKALGRGILDRQSAEKLLKSHTQTGGNGKELFSYVFLELWHREFIDTPARQVAAGW